MMSASAVDEPLKCPFLTNHELKLVQDSWVEVKKLGYGAVGALLFKNIFTAAPEALSFFSFKDEANLYESKSFSKHATSVVGTVGVAVSKLEDVASLVPVLQKLGADHGKIGSEGNRIVQAHYDLVGQQLIVSHDEVTQIHYQITVNFDTLSVLSFIALNIMRSMQTMLLACSDHFLTISCTILFLRPPSNWG